MNANELREIREAILEDPDMEIFARNVAHVISYLISEQEKRVVLNAAIERLTEKLAGYEKSQAEQGFDLKAINERGARNSKLLMTIAGSMLTALGLELLRLLK